MTGKVDGKYLPGRDGSQVITLPELLGAGPGGLGGRYMGTAGVYDSLTNTLKTNFTNNLPSMAMAVIGIPIAVRVATKLIQKPVITPANRLLKMTGLDIKL